MLSQEDDWTGVDPWASGLIDEPTRMAILQALGDLLRRARIASGLMMTELADRCGMSQSVLCRIELARRTPSIWQLMNICEQLGIRLSDVICAAEDAAVPLPLAREHLGRFAELLGKAETPVARRRSRHGA